MPEPKLLSDLRGNVLTLTLNRPAKLNGIDNELADGLRQSLDGAATDAAVHVVRLRGNGRAFCAGRDVSAAPTDKDLELIQAVVRAIVAHPKPVVAAVHGWVVGAGLEWTLTSDIVVMAEDARLKLPEAAIGVFVTGGLVATLPASVGLARTKALMLLGDEFNAPQALAWGIAQQVVPVGELDRASWTISTRLAALRPELAREFKRLLNLIGLPGFDRAIDMESGATPAGWWRRLA